VEDSVRKVFGEKQKSVWDLWHDVMEIVWAKKIVWGYHMVCYGTNSERRENERTRRKKINNVY
jgi:hypothetical protein